jgi:hypothetical protein
MQINLHEANNKLAERTSKVEHLVIAWAEKPLLELVPGRS